ncbi:hypothetical protein L210DRAFT_987667 [Boletus edulis BED1]|uniref:Uncharacterized protein n=1 Tax=Boletus edulis BED1 TaxID=1328754 RepID=A0AAD4BQ26_BOLED|nr:hypothetical protein L210DRAFT_987667 [Boletus edulis BED1]
MPLGILRYTPSAFSSIQHLLADICSSLMKTPLITVVSVDPLDYSGETSYPPTLYLLWQTPPPNHFG